MMNLNSRNVLIQLNSLKTFILSWNALTHGEDGEAKHSPNETWVALSANSTNNSSKTSFAMNSTELQIDALCIWFCGCVSQSSLSLSFSNYFLHSNNSFNRLQYWTISLQLQRINFTIIMIMSANAIYDWTN